MRRSTSLYLGYANPRAAVSIDGHNIVVLLDGESNKVLKGMKASRFRRELSALSNHLCGVVMSADVAEFIRDHPGGLNAYNALFDKYFT